MEIETTGSIRRSTSTIIMYLRPVLSRFSLSGGWFKSAFKKNFRIYTGIHSVDSLIYTST